MSLTTAVSGPNNGVHFSPLHDMPQGGHLHLHRQLEGLHKTVLKKCRTILAKIT